MKKYSGNEVNRAGNALRDADAVADPIQVDHALDVLAYWRYSHEASLEHASSLLQSVATRKDPHAIFAKRPKRLISIFKKLVRFPKMELKNMQDIGGCRAIVASPKKLDQVVRELRKLPAFKNSSGKIRAKNYISNPKSDGYRSYHLIGKFPNEDGDLRNIELQIRTRIQHYWATGLEVAELFTGHALKSNEGDEKWKELFRLVSSQLAIMESIHLFDSMEPLQQFQAYAIAAEKSPHAINTAATIYNYSKELGVAEKLEAFAGSLKVIRDKTKEGTDSGNVLVEIDLEIREVTHTRFAEDDGDAAEQAYTEAEKRSIDQEHKVVALVSTNRLRELENAYPNYFADASGFLQLLEYINKAGVSKKPSMFQWLLGPRPS